jgi:alginate O-acetyltransferase complex protein AlgI
VPFASYTFVLLFLPASLAGFVLLGRRVAMPRIVWLIAASLLFYAQSSIAGLALLVASAVTNFWIGRRLAFADRDAQRTVLWLALGLNLFVLALAKYAPLFNVFGTPGLSAVAMPVAVSFFTFQQISYLVDIYRGDLPAARLVDYLCFVTFFPKLLAGPIARARDLLPQIAEAGPAFGPATFAAGLTLFAIGLMKKVLLANALLPTASASFGVAAAGAVDFGQAWTGALAYTLGLYFDFSGYTDMAIAVALMFGIRLPANFNSPYRAVNIRDFWRRWHMTLSNLFFEYIYVPVAMAAGRRTVAGPYLALIVTMLLCGVWHGAGWTFIVWGGLHGSYLVVNYGWQSVRARLPVSGQLPVFAGSLVAGAVTFLAVTISWVPFRADDLGAATRMLAAMLAPRAIFSGLAGLADGIGAVLVAPVAAARAGVTAAAAGLPIFWIIAGLAIVWTMPNSLAIVPLVEAERPQPGGDLPWWQWRPSNAWGIASGLATVASLFLIWGRQVEFIYFKF